MTRPPSAIPPAAGGGLRLFGGGDRAAVAAAVRAFLADPAGADPGASGPRTLAVVADSPDDLRRKLEYAAARLEDPKVRRIQDRSGIFYSDEPLASAGGTAFVFPGEGAQYPGMLRDLCLRFPGLCEDFDRADAASSDAGGLPLSVSVFPPGGSGDPESPGAIWEMAVAVQAVTTANRALLRFATDIGIRPAAAVGHSSGEFAALEAAGILRFGDSARQAAAIREGHRVARALAAGGNVRPAALVTVGGMERSDLDAVVSAAGGEVLVAMDNCPHQHVLCGRGDQLSAAVAAIVERGGITGELPFDRPYHTPWFEPALEPLRAFLEQQEIGPGSIPLYSCSRAAPYPDDRAGIVACAVEQWARPVRFTETIRRMHDDGIRIFVEIGPRGNLTSFVSDILRDRPHLAVALDRPNRSGIRQMQTALAALAAHGVPFDPPVFERPRTERPAAEKPLDMRLPELRLAARPAAAERATAAAPAAPPPPPAANPRDRAMAAHLATMESFLASQAAVVKALLSRSADAVPASPRTTAPRGPLLDRTLESGGGRLVVERRYTGGDDLFLDDHAFGVGSISTEQPELRPLRIVPLVMSLEMMAEAAAELFPGTVVAGIADVLAYRWIALENPTKTVRVVAVRDADAGGKRAKVRILDTEDGPRRTDPLLVEGTVLLADGYPAPVPAAPFAPVNAVSKGWTRKDIYPVRLFHGPTFQGIHAIPSWAENGVEGTVETLPTAGLFRSRPDARFLIDPLLIDNVGQTVDVWTNPEPYSGTVYLPFKVERIRFLGPPRPAGEKLAFRYVVRENRDLTVVSDISVVAPDGSLHMDIDGWCDRGWVMGPNFHRVYLEPDRFLLGDDWPGAGEAGSIIAGHPSGLFARSHRIWETALAFMFLDEEERRAWRNAGPSPADRLDWLLGRAAAKDAVRRLLRARGAPCPPPADVRIRPDGAADGAWTGAAGGRPRVSFAAAGGVAAAAAWFRGAWCVGAASSRLPADTARRLATARTALSRALGRPDGASASAALDREEPGTVYLRPADGAAVAVELRESPDTLAAFCAVPRETT